MIWIWFPIVAVVLGIALWIIIKVLRHGGGSGTPHGTHTVYEGGKER